MDNSNNGLTLAQLAAGQAVTIGNPNATCNLTNSQPQPARTEIDSVPTPTATPLDLSLIGNDCSSITFQVKNVGDTARTLVFGVYGMTGKAILYNEQPNASDFDYMQSDDENGIQSKVISVQGFNDKLTTYGAVVLKDLEVSGFTADSAGAAQRNQNLIMKTKDYSRQTCAQSKRRPTCGECVNSNDPQTVKFKGIFPVGHQKSLEYTINPGQELEFELGVLATETQGLYTASNC